MLYHIQRQNLWRNEVFVFVQLIKTLPTYHHDLWDQEPIPAENPHEFPTAARLRILEATGFNPTIIWLSMCSCYILEQSSWGTSPWWMIFPSLWQEMCHACLTDFHQNGTVTFLTWTANRMNTDDDSFVSLLILIFGARDQFNCYIVYNFRDSLICMVLLKV